MNKQSIQTPAILLNLDALENNIKVYQDACTNNGKEMWPMIKTHKSTKIVEMQMEAGSEGVLCGTLDEAEACANANIKKVMYAYPVASKESIERIIELTKKCDFIIRLDNIDGAKMISDAAVKAGVQISYTIIIDSGLHRFGVAPEKAVSFANTIKNFEGIKLRGISTHPGHVYSSQCKNDIQKYIESEANTIKIAVESLQASGYELELVTTGSTPTFFAATKNKYINIVHPGNYVFLDAIQMSLEVAKEKDCALTILATIISHPNDELFICDAGAKCLGLDQGAHGNSSIIGFGKVKNYPEILVSALSEEVGKLHVNGPTKLKVGDKIEIIPNHSCSSANLTSYYVCTKNDKVVDLIKVDIRGNSTKKNIIF